MQYISNAEIAKMTGAHYSTVVKRAKALGATVYYRVPEGGVRESIHYKRDEVKELLKAGRKAVKVPEDEHDSSKHWVMYVPWDRSGLEGMA